jgi:high-affinity Fe2+/Pb2+ permease
VVLAAAGVAAGLALMVIWTLLAAVYAAPARLIGALANRDLNWPRAWKLAVASLMPGALMMVAGMIGYGTGLLDLVKLAVCTGLHLVVGWAYVAVSPLFLPPRPATSPRHKNPFAAAAPPDDGGSPRDAR